MHLFLNPKHEQCINFDFTADAFITDHCFILFLFLCYADGQSTSVSQQIASHENQHERLVRAGEEAQRKSIQTQTEKDGHGRKGQAADSTTIAITSP